MSPATIQIILAALSSGGLITGFAAWRKGQIEARVGNDTTTLAAMSTLNDRLNADNLQLRAEVKDLHDEVVLLRNACAELPSLRRRIGELEHALEQAKK